MEVPVYMRTAISGILILACTAAFGQATDSLTFEVATVRLHEVQQAPSISGGPGIRGGPGTADPGRMTWTGEPLHKLLWIAYGLPQYQVTGPNQRSHGEPRHSDVQSLLRVQPCDRRQAGQDRVVLLDRDPCSCSVMWTRGLYMIAIIILTLPSL
jgi:hypothetical protein